MFHIGKKSARIAFKMFRIILEIGYLATAILFGLTLLLWLRVAHDLNKKLPEENKIYFFSNVRGGLSLHHQFFPHSHLARATKAFSMTGYLLLGAVSLLRLLTL
jgi:hypothetical protein